MFPWRVGFLIPKGWKVMPLFRNIHHNPDYFQDPHKFDPSRFQVHTGLVSSVLTAVDVDACQETTGNGSCTWMLLRSRFAISLYLVNTTLPSSQTTLYVYTSSIQPPDLESPSTYLSSLHQSKGRALSIFVNSKKVKEF